MPPPSGILHGTIIGVHWPFLSFPSVFHFLEVTIVIRSFFYFLLYFEVCSLKVQKKSRAPFELGKSLNSPIHKIIKSGHWYKKIWLNTGYLDWYEHFLLSQLKDIKDISIRCRSIKGISFKYRFNYPRCRAASVRDATQTGRWSTFVVRSAENDRNI